MEKQDLTFWKNYQTAMGWIANDEETEETSDFEIDDELLEFYRQTKNHRAHRKNKKHEEKTEENRIELIPGEQMGPNVKTVSKLPPINRAKLRQLELEWLYGTLNATHINQRETEVQMRFDQMFDKKQPMYFPSLPNRLRLEPKTYGQHTTRPNLLPIVNLTVEETNS